ncbi:MAG: hypothetical protein ACJA0E_000513 [Bermanella sp.]
MTLFEIRRINASELMKENALDELSFALCLGIDESQMLELLTDKSTKKISDSLARLMEQTFSKPGLWLDQANLEGAGTGPSFDLFG